MKKNLKNILILLLTVSFFVPAISTSASIDADVPTVFVIGDSTAADYGNSGANDMTGWAQVLYNYFEDSYMIEDYAEPGASSKSFYNSDYLWGSVKPKIKKGDYVLIQFGHNDSKTSRTEEDTVPVPDPNRFTSPTDSVETEGSFKWYLNKFVQEVREKEAVPVFVTSIERRIHALLKIANPDTYNSELYSYVSAMKALGAETGVPVIDLHTESIDLISDYEKEKEGSSENLFMISVLPETLDNTHLTQKGAMELSKRFALLLENHNDELLVNLKNYLVEDTENVVFTEKLFRLTEDFENPSLIGTSIISGYNGWGIRTSSPVWNDKDIIFNQKENNMSAKFTAKVADIADANQIDSNRKLRFLEYDLSSVTNSDYFKLEYSVKSNGVPHEFQVILDGVFVGNVNFNGNKIAGKTYNGSPDINGWYNIKIVASTKSGRTYIYVNNNLHKETINLLSSRLKVIQFGLVRTICSGADIEIDDIALRFITKDDFYNETGLKKDESIITPAVFVIGDSTAADYGNSGANDMTGWAQVLYNYFEDSYMIEDYAEPGASSKSFYNSDYLWGSVKPKIKKGDYVLIQFGHNDSKTSRTEEDTVPVPDPNRFTSPTDSVETEGSFKWYLNKFVQEVREKEAIPVFVTSIERRNHALLKIANPDTYNSELYSYVSAMKALGAETGVPVIDLHTESIDLISDYEKEKEGSSENLFMISVLPETLDNTHLTQKGAMELSKRFALLLENHNDELLVNLKNYLVEDTENVEFTKKLFRLTEDFENPSLIDTSISNGYNGWKLQISSSDSWKDKDIVFNKEESENITARFTAALPDTSDETQIDKNRKLYLFNYDLSNVTNSDYFKLEYSVKSNGIPHEFQVILNGVFAGNVDFANTKISTKSFDDENDNGWYHIKLFCNSKNGKTYVYVNNKRHNELVHNWSDKINFIQFGLVRTICSGADIELDNIKMQYMSEEDFCTETDTVMYDVFNVTSLIKDNENINGISVEAGHSLNSNQKLITAVYSPIELTLKGTAFAEITEDGRYDIVFKKPIPYKDGDTVKVYFWNSDNLSPFNVFTDTFE